MRMFKNKLIKIITSVMLLLTAGLSAFAQSREVPFTLDDRDRLIKLEERVSSTNERITSLEKSLDVKFDGINGKFDGINDKFDGINDKFDQLYNLIYFILAGVFGLIGLIMWDRRSYIKPVKEDIRDIAAVLKDYAKDQPKLAEILRARGIL